MLVCPGCGFKNCQAGIRKIFRAGRVAFRTQQPCVCCMNWGGWPHGSGCSQERKESMPVCLPYWKHLFHSKESTPFETAFAVSPGKKNVFILIKRNFCFPAKLPETLWEMLLFSWYQGVQSAWHQDCHGIISAAGKGDGCKKHTPSPVNALESEAYAWSLTTGCLGTSKPAGG